VAAREALDIAPDDPGTLRRAAWSALAAGQREESRAQLARLTAVAGRNAASHQYEAELAALLGDAEIAAQAARTVREEGGGRIRRTLAAGYAAAAAGSWVRARKRFEAALLLDPNGCCAHTWLGLAAVAEGDTAVAHSAYERAEAIEMCECASRLRLRAELEPA
jgi:Tfp pilus assembly protein PilF